MSEWQTIEKIYNEEELADAKRRLQAQITQALDIWDSRFDRSATIAADIMDMVSDLAKAEYDRGMRDGLYSAGPE